MNPTSKDIRPNPFQSIFDEQKAYFQTNVTKSYEWRIAQLDHMARMLIENEARLQGAIGAEDEVFGPILPILTYNSLDEALRQIISERRTSGQFTDSC